MGVIWDENRQFTTQHDRIIVTALDTVNETLSEILYELREIRTSIERDR